MTVSKATEEDLARLGRALAHPTRVRMIARLIDGGKASPRALSDQLNEPLGNVSYHMRYLAELRVVNLQSTTPRRGALEHFYVLSSDVAALAKGQQAMLAGRSNGAS